MIVFDASTLVGVVIKVDSVPALAFRRALDFDTLAISIEVGAEYLDVLHRPRLSRFIASTVRAEVLALINSQAVSFRPEMHISDCRDAKDNKYLELALASGAGVIVSSDNDLLVLDPWRGVRILKPADYLVFGA